MLCHRRRKTPKSPTENQRTEQYNNKAYEDIFDEPIVRPEHEGGPSTSPVGPQQFENEIYGMGPCSNSPVMNSSQPAEYDKGKLQPEQSQHHNPCPRNIKEKIPLSKAKPVPTKESSPPDYERLTVRYQNLTQPSKVGKEETDA